MEGKESMKLSLGIVVCIFIIVLLIFALGIVYYLGFIQNNIPQENKKVAINNEKINPDEMNKENSLSNPSITVEDAVNYTDGYYNLFKVKLPKIQGNTPAINNLNEKILNEILPRTYSDVAVHATTEDSEIIAMDKGAIYDYKYLIRNNVLVLYIYSSVPEGGTEVPATGGGLENISYYYDIENDKLISLSEAASQLGLSLSGLQTLDGNSIKSYDELENNDFMIIIENNNLKLKMILN